MKLFANLKSLIIRSFMGIGLFAVVGSAYAGVGHAWVSVMNLSSETSLEFYNFQSKCTNDTEQRLANGNYTYQFLSTVRIDKNFSNYQSCNGTTWWFSASVRSTSGAYVGSFTWIGNVDTGDVSYVFSPAQGHSFTNAPNGMLVIY